MEILFDNPLANMYGPYFLLFYAVVIFSTFITLLIVKRLIDRTNRLPQPGIPHNIDPYEIAFLRGGTNEMVRSVVFGLIQRDLLVLNQNTIQKKISSNPLPNLKNVELVALDWFASTRDVKEIFGANGLVTQLKGYGDSYEQNLRNQQMLTDDVLIGSFAIFKWLAFLLVFSLGAYKAISAILHGRFNIMFIVIFGIVGLVIAGFASKMPRLTKLGKIYLERLQMAFDSLKAKSQNLYNQATIPTNAPQTTFAGVDPLLLSVGVFGGGVLAGTMYDSYNQAFQKSQNASAVSSSSCGAGCGTCSSSDSGGSSCSSGSSCSGGSSCSSGCGGGCGGCGG